MQVLAAVGTDHHPFCRLLTWMRDIDPSLYADVTVQRGATPHLEGIRSVDYVAADELATMMRSADAVVCHGGPGTISLAIDAGHRPIVVPRNPDLGEHVDDHQIRFASRLAEEGTIDVALSMDDLTRLLRSPRARVDVRGSKAESEEAVANLQCLIERSLSCQLPRRPWRQRVLVRRSP